MAHRIGQKEESRAKILRGAGRGFRRAGFGGAGVDGLAKEAGVTSGVFYAQFKSKAAAFCEATVAGLRQLKDGIDRFRARDGDRWRAIIGSAAEGLACKPKARRDEATALLALLVGGVTLARAVHDEEYGKEIAAAVRKAALHLSNG